MNYNLQYEKYQNTFHAALETAMSGMRYSPEILGESMRYSLQSGGKRIRPVLFYAALDAFGKDYSRECGLAIALECIHTYSLIHDDLPAMDNDDYRRGRLSNHKVFGEANAILAGDALLSYAFDLLLKEGGRSAMHLRAAQALSKAAGAEGMIAGQSADLFYEKREAGERELTEIYRNKTGKLIAAPVIMAAHLAEHDIEEAEAFGMALGCLFQITDDILDVVGQQKELGKTVGKDEREDKLTAVKVYGLDRAQKIADEHLEQCLASLENMGANTAFLQTLAKNVRVRSK